jgi:hypothetical protein
MAALVREYNTSSENEDKPARVFVGAQGPVHHASRLDMQRLGKARSHAASRPVLVFA